MNYLDISRRTIGVNFYEPGRASVRLWAPEATNVELLIPGKNKIIPLICGEFGYWHAETQVLNPGDLYYFVLDGKKQLPDPASLSQPQDMHGPSQALDLDSFAWENKNWNNLSLQKYIIYEIHLGTFTPEGTFFAVEQKLDYLLGLGITAIEIMPVAQFPGRRNWGYDGVFPFCVQHAYEGAEGLQRLVNACQLRGFAVILDVVFNHVARKEIILKTLALISLINIVRPGDMRSILTTPGAMLYVSFILKTL